eukprot:4583514-Pleurochrysis_carterae.AAC.1
MVILSRLDSALADAEEPYGFVELFPVAEDAYRMQAAAAHLGVGMGGECFFLKGRLPLRRLEGVLGH